MMLRPILVAQFKRPHGVLGRLAGFIMAHRPSNRERNAWTVGLLGLEPHHRVLEIGSGPGVALQRCAERVTEGWVIGIDHSEVMVAQARRRVAGQLGNGRVEVRLGGLAELPLERGGFDRVFSLNVVQFFPDLTGAMGKIQACLVEGGVAATTFQPRSPHPSREEAHEMAGRIEEAMDRVGFLNIQRHELPVDPVPVVCVTGVRGGRCHAGARQQPGAGEP